MAGVNKAPQSVKCVVVGDGGVGKTCMLMVYVQGVCQRDYIPTVYDNYTATLMFEGAPVQLNLWDTSGQDNYARLRPLAYPQTDVFLLCFALDNKDSFENVKEKWILELRHHCPTTPIILVGTKKDLRDDKKTKFCLDKSEGELMAYRLETDSYVECSSYTMDNVDAVFRNATRAALYKPKRRKKRRCRLL